MNKIKTLILDLYWVVKHSRDSTVNWISNHFRLDFWRIILTALRGYPWDEYFIYSLEYAKIREMRNYHKRTQNTENWGNVVRDMSLCLSLIEIFTEERELYRYTHYKKQDNGCYVFDEDLTYHCMVRVNLKNIKRFIEEEKIPHVLKNPHELYKIKAKSLYHKIRLGKDISWWD